MTALRLAVQAQGWQTEQELDNGRRWLAWHAERLELSTAAHKNQKLLTIHESAENARAKLEKRKGPSKKRNSMYPDFVHAFTGESLWIYLCQWVPRNLKCLDDSRPAVARGMRTLYMKGDARRSYVSDKKLHWSEDSNTDCGQGREAIRIYDKMREDGVELTISMIVAALKACTSLRDLQTGMRIHADVIENRGDSSIFVANTLLDMYAKCGSMVHARRVFDKMAHHSVVSWNAIILGHARNEEGELALQIFAQMQKKGFAPNARTFVAALKSCTSLAVKEEGKQVQGELVKIVCLEKGIAIHSEASKSGNELDIFVASTLVDMYAKCGSMVDARQIFDRMPHHDVVSWNAIILGYVQSGEGELALQLFARMRNEGFTPDARTFVAALQACASLAVQEEGKQVEGKLVKVVCLEKGIAIHSQVSKCGHELDIFVGNTLVDMYAKCGSLMDARRVFDKMPTHSVVSWNAIIMGCAQGGDGELALQLFSQMQDKGFTPDARTFVAALQACTTLAAKEEGKQVGEKIVKMVCLEKGIAIHSQVAKSGHDSDIFVSSSLVGMYSKCGSMLEAHRVFDIMPHHGVVSWNAIITGYAQCGEGELALQLFAQMQDEGCTPDARTFVAALNACSSLSAKEQGKQVQGEVLKMACLEKGIAIHSQAAKSGLDLDIFVANTLVDMYAKCGSMVNARRVFDSMPHHDVVSWNAISLGYARNGEGKLPLKLSAQMQEEGFTSDARTLDACTSLARQDEGEKIHGVLVKQVSLEKDIAFHSQVANSGHDSGIIVANTLADTYAKYGSMAYARRGMLNHSVLSGLSLKYGQNGEGELALQLNSRIHVGDNKLSRWGPSKTNEAIETYDMREDGVEPSIAMVIATLKACTNLTDLQAVHADVIDCRYDSSIFVANTLVDMFAKCGSIVDARRVFDSMLHHTVVSWNAIILGYAQSGEGELGLQLFVQMQDEGFTPNARTFVAALKSCTSLAAKEEGKQVQGGLVKKVCLEKGIAIHSQVAKSGYNSNIFVANTLVDMYAKCGSMVDARRVFDTMACHDVVSWTAIILGYAHSGEGELALQLFSQMQDKGFTPDARTFVAALNACTSLTAKAEGKLGLLKIVCLEMGIAIHSQVAKSGHELDIFVASTLVDMYAKCGSMVDARGVFDKMPHHGVVSWNAIILGYVQSGEGALALQLFVRMRDEGFTPDALTFLGALKACGSLAALETGRKLHAEICVAGLRSDAAIATGLIDFYGKCGSMVDAQQVFDSIATRDLVTWTALIVGYSHQGDTKHVFDLFERMQKERLQADGVTFLSILTVCSHAGLVDKGKEYFQCMCSNYLVTADIEHYTCMVDLLGRANHLDEAVAMVKNMPFEPDLRIWMTVLGACRKWRNVAVGRLAFESILILDDKNASAYVLMANIYAGAGMWEESAKIQAMRRNARAWKKPGQSWWTDNAGRVHTFAAGDTSHPQSEDIQAKLKDVLIKMKEEGYVPDLDSVLHNISDDEKESALCGHSERLAIGCALINTAPGTPIRIVKNLRVCDDCHKATAIMSKTEQRSIICRDASRFHVFKDGKCSCGDFW